MKSTERTIAKKEKFLSNLGKTGNVTKSCKLSGLSRRHAYQLRDAEPEFKAAWNEAIEIYIDSFEAEVDRRAIKGTLKPVFQNGRKVGQVREFSDTLAIFRLKALKPEKYRDNQSIEHSGPGGGPIAFTMDPDAAKGVVDKMRGGL